LTARFVGCGCAGGQGKKNNKRNSKRGGNSWDTGVSAQVGGAKGKPAYRIPPVFKFSFAPEDRQVQLKTGSVSPENVPVVRAEIKRHTNFSSELNLVDKTTHARELYYLRIVAANLARNPRMSAEQKQSMIKEIREIITEGLPPLEDDA
jgi:hypothetical protein